MDSNALDYLLRLAALSIAFVGFATIVVTLRRGLGGELSPFHLLLVRIYVEIGLIVAVGAVIPNLLSQFSLPPRSIWQISSALAGIIAPAFLIRYLRRWRSLQIKPMPARIYFRYLVSTLAVIALWLNAFGLLFQPGGGIYSVSLTWFLFTSGLVFVQTLDEILYHKPDA
jgi:hypothetical protein